MIKKIALLLLIFISYEHCKAQNAQLKGSWRFVTMEMVFFDNLMHNTVFELNDSAKMYQTLISDFKENDSTKTIASADSLEFRAIAEKFYALKDAVIVFDGVKNYSSYFLSNNQIIEKGTYLFNAKLNKLPQLRL